MGFEAATCPSCGAEIMVPNDRQTIKCMYCGSEIVVRDATKSQAGDSIENWMKLATAASESGNHSEAYSYYSKILELDVSHGEAWFNRAISAGWQTTLGNSRLAEMVNGINTGIEKLGDTEVVRQRATRSISEVALAYYELAGGHFTKFISVDGAWVEYLESHEHVADCLRTAYNIYPSDVTPLKQLIGINKDVITGRSYYHDGDSWDLRTHAITKEYSEKLKKEIEEFTTIIMKVEPDYQERSADSPKSTCFIATAACGTYLHPDVVVLRCFRDNYLLTNWIGRTFVAVYAHFGPMAARIIFGRKAVCFVVRLFMVTPAAFIARSILAISKRS